jgi:hypothetical protein
MIDFNIKSRFFTAFFFFFFFFIREVKKREGANYAIIREKNKSNQLFYNKDLNLKCEIEYVTFASCKSKHLNNGPV